MAHGFRLRALTVGDFCDFMWHMMTRNAEAKDVDRFRQQLWMPPKGEAPDPRSPWSPENETKMFKAAKAQWGGG